MCGRYSFSNSKEEVATMLPSVEVSSTEWKPNYNIAPTQKAYVVTDAAPTKLTSLIWGLIPHWSNYPKNNGRLINARIEGISSKPSFRLPVRKSRCLVLADSFYEWRKEPMGKVPYRIRLKEQPLMVMGGIWDIWKDKTDTLQSFSIITTQPNEELKQLHNRMPVILTTPEQWNLWLNPDTPLETIINLSTRMPDDILTYYRVSKAVNTVKHNSATNHKEFKAPPSLF